MQRLLKIVFWTSIILPCFWILTTILGNFVPLEFSNNDSEFVYDSIRGFGFPIAIMLTLTGTIKSKDTAGAITTKIVLTIVVAALSFFIIVMTAFAGMCDWTTDKIYFENKQNSAIKIVQRSFGCGATDSSPATLKVFKVREITPYLIWVTSIDTTQINKNNWTRIENKEQ